MNEQILIDDVCQRMIAFDRGDAKRIQHFLKVHAYARLIAHGEKVDTKTQRIIELAALVHDIASILPRKNTAAAMANCRSRKDPRQPANF